MLNTQRKIAEDSEGVSSPVLCRLFKTLDEASYTKQFWKAPCLAYVFERVQHSVKKKREAQLREFGQRRQADMERYSKELLRREVSRNRWQAKEARDGDAAHMKESRSASLRQDSAITRKGSDDMTSALERLGASFAKKTR